MSGDFSLFVNAWDYSDDLFINNISYTRTAKSRYRLHRRYTIQYGVKEDITNDKMTTVRESLVKNGIENPYLQVIHVNDQADSNLKSILSIRTKFIDEGSADQDKCWQLLIKTLQTRNLFLLHQ